MRCHRPLTTATATVKTRGVPQFVGPRCAQRMGLLNPGQPRQKRTTAPNPAQADLFPQPASPG